jgi:hypothetical protein
MSLVCTRALGFPTLTALGFESPHFVQLLGCIISIIIDNKVLFIFVDGL